jgi:glycosyltransferase involved in cell wall biosynthesis
VASLLSVLMPVQNVQDTLTTTVHEILEVISECTRDFELLIIDNGSTDATSEVAMELTRVYPQINVVCNGRAQGRESLFHQGLLLSRGETVLIQEEEGGIPLEEIARTWKTARLKSQFLCPGESPNPEIPRAEPLPARAPLPELMRIEGFHASAEKMVPRISRKSGFRLLPRPPQDMLSASKRPVRPNFLDRVHQFSAER